LFLITMHTSLRTRIFLNTLGVLLAGMTLAAVLAWIAVERLYLSTQQENLLAQARLTAASLQGADLAGLAAEPYSQTTNIQPGIHTHVLDEADAVVLALPIESNVMSSRSPFYGDSRSTSAEELLQRSEIISALQGTPATAVRRVALAGGPRVLYAAAPVYSKDNAITGIVYLAMPLPAGGLPAASILQFAGALLAAVLLAVLAGALLARRIARPLEGFVSAAQDVSRGDLGRRVPTGSGIAELDSLGAAFNAMTDSLRRSEQARNAFLADVTHELRTPLTVIKGTAETLEDGAVDDPEGRVPLLRSMQRETDRLIRMVNDLLVLTRFDAGGLRLDLRPLDLAELACSRCAQLAPLAAGRGISLQADAASDVPLCADADRLAQVLDNLLDNAIRHAPDGSTVTVTVRREGREAVCAVTDRGPGIPPEHLPLIFDRFYRADSSRNRGTGGAGLGLAIARALVAAHSGRIEAYSTVGEGTTVTFHLPFKDCPPPA
jgi:two-component system, OmpR family, sensor histidine kinase BaeS